MSAYYNENDSFAAAWLRNLILADLIAPGEVDERSIEQVKPEDLRGFTQCHFFAGVGVWSYALRNAGWRDNESVWTGSCPCPPFSSAGKSKACPQCNGTNPVPHVGRTGYFVCCLCDHEWFADARHLWPEMWRLISFYRPDTFFGEQVAPSDGRTWLTSVRASLEILGYAVGTTDLCSAGFGASDIRQRLYFVANSQRQQFRARRSGSVEPKATGMQGEIGKRQRVRDDFGERGASSIMDEPNGTGSQSGRQTCAPVGHRNSAVTASGTCGLANTQDANGRRAGNPRDGRRWTPEVGGSSVAYELAHTDCPEPSNGELQRGGRLVQPSENPLAGFWANAEWIYCRDGKYRPVEPGTFPLAHGATNRVGRLRGYGNALNAEVAKGFIEAYMSTQQPSGNELVSALTE